MAWEVTEEDVCAALQQMGAHCDFDDPRLPTIHAKILEYSNRIEKAALYGNDMETQTRYATEEIIAILKENPEFLKGS